MNKSIAIYSSAVNLVSVIGFAVCMLLDFNFGSYMFSIFIALGFVAMMCGYALFSPCSVFSRRTVRHG